MKKTALFLFISLCLILSSSHAALVQAQPPTVEAQDLPPFPPEFVHEDEAAWLRHLDETPEEDRVFTPPTAESLKRTQEQVQAFDCGTVTDVPRAECEALVALYESTNGAGWKDNTNWLTSTTVGNWKGVTTSDGHVTTLDLPENNLSGTIPAKLGQLSALQTLKLGRNNLNGSIPPELGQLSALIDLRLFANKLSGNIPLELGQLSALQVFHLDFNKLNGSIPAELGQLSNLRGFYANNNKLNGNIPPEIGQLSNLVLFRLHDNQLSGNIPKELGNLTLLTHLFLHKNNLSGPIPKELGNLNKLMFLDLNSNRLSGNIPSNIGQLTRLIHLDISHNKLEGDVPASFTNLVDLCVEGDTTSPCNWGIKTDLGYNWLNVPQPNPPSDFLYLKDPDWDLTQNIGRYKLYLPTLLKK